MSLEVRIAVGIESFFILLFFVFSMVHLKTRKINAELNSMTIYSILSVLNILFFWAAEIGWIKTPTARDANSLSLIPHFYILSRLLINRHSGQFKILNLSFWVIGVLLIPTILYDIGNRTTFSFFLVNSCLVVYTLFYFKNLPVLNPRTNLNNDAVFWIATGVSVSMLGTLPIHFVLLSVPRNFVFKHHYISMISTIPYDVLYIFFSKSLLCNLQKNM